MENKPRKPKRFTLRIVLLTLLMLLVEVFAGSAAMDALSDEPMEEE